MHLTIENRTQIMKRLLRQGASTFACVEAINRRNHSKSIKPESSALIAEPETKTTINNRSDRAATHQLDSTSLFTLGKRLPPVVRNAKKPRETQVFLLRMPTNVLQDREMYLASLDYARQRLYVCRRTVKLCQ